MLTNENNQTQENWIQLSVKYPGLCKECGIGILEGETALWSKSLKVIKHVDCASIISKTADNKAKTDDLDSCPECGINIPQDAHFCPGCGTKLNPSLNNTNQYIARATKIEGLTREQQEEDKPRLTPEELGVRLEDMTVELLKSMGYSTEVRKLFRINNVPYEIDVIAKKGEKLMAVECKNYSHPVGIAELREFHDKLIDLKISDALFVTNSIFTDNAIAYADSKNIKHWDRREFYEKFGDMKAGRYGSKQEIVLFLSIPITIRYEDATKLFLQNASKVKLHSAKLVMHPYNSFDYSIDIQRTDPVRNIRRVHDAGVHIVDCLDGEILTAKEGGITNMIGSILKSSEEKIANAEQDAIVNDLQTIKPEAHYKIRPSTTYDTSILKPEISFKCAKISVVEQVVKDNTKDFHYQKRISRNSTVRRKFTVIPRWNDVWIKKASMVFVPKWIIEFEVNNTVYTRKIMASSSTVIKDDIAFCPKHFVLGKIQLGKKATVAVCESCGLALCQDHVVKIGEKYYCNEHDPEKPVNTDGKLSSIKKGLGGLGSIVKKL